jgi:hypothetical protein
MSFWKKIFGTGKEKRGPQEEARKEYVLVIDGPEFGPIGEELLTRIMKEAVSRLRARYGNLIRKTESFFDLEKGSTSLLVYTESIAAEQAQGISAFGLACLKEEKRRGQVGGERSGG